MSAPAIFPIGKDAWWWDSPPSTISEYNDESNKHSSPAEDYDYHWCWFVDYEEILYDHETLVDGGVTYTFAYARFVDVRGVYSPRVLDTVTSIDGEGWVEISGSDVKRVAKLPPMCDYDFDVENKHVTLLSCRPEFIGKSYVARKLTPNKYETIADCYSLGGRYQGGYIAGEVLAALTDSEAIHPSRYSPSFWITLPLCVISITAGYTPLPVYVANVLITVNYTKEDTGIGLVLPVFAVVPCRFDASDPYIPQEVSDIFIEDKAIAATQALKQNETWGDVNLYLYRKNATHVAIPTSITTGLTLNDTLGVAVGSSCYAPCIDPIGSLEPVMDYDYHVTQQSWDSNNWPYDKYEEVAHLGITYVDDATGKPTIDLPTAFTEFTKTTFANYIYPCEYVCPDDNDDTKSWYQLVYNLNCYIRDNDEENFGFKVCELFLPTDYFEPYFGQTMRVTLPTELTDPTKGHLRCTRVPVRCADYGTPPVMLNVDIPQDVTGGLPCQFGFAKDGINWYWIIVGSTCVPSFLQETTPPPNYPSYPVMYWFCAEDNDFVDMSDPVISLVDLVGAPRYVIE